MLKEEPCDGGGINTWARACDTCGTAACAVFCLADTAYLCSACDARVHAANRLASRHERVRVCESCERAPAAFLCKADAASLCAACDSEVHSANPLARRHQRVPILFQGSDQSCCDDPLLLFNEEAAEEEDEDEEAASWLLVDQGNAGNLLDLVEYSDSGKAEDIYVEVKGSGVGSDDSVVPIEFGDGGEGYSQLQLQQHLFLGLEFEPASKDVHSYDTISVVPESSLSLEMVSVAHPRLPKGTIDLFSGTPQVEAPPVQLTGIEREARVMRYREKKKTRKFMKTIRYASRKAYAETRPRIKGRFAKRADIVDHMFSVAAMTADETGYGIVPTF